MADLDDFFAKKDKKKSKSKKFVTSELKQLEVVTKEKEQKNNDESTEGATTNENNVDNDEEWGEFEESKRPDLSNLKLGQLTFDEEQHNQNAGGADNESENTNQFNNDGSDSSENPWKKAQENAAKEQKPVPAAAESKPGVYVPRFGGDTSAKARKKNAPDLKSEGMFPSLGTDKPINEQVKNKKDGFQEVTHGIKKEQSTSTNFQIPLSSTVYSSLFNNEVDS